MSVQLLNEAARHLNFFFKIWFMLDMQGRLFLEKTHPLRKYHGLGTLGASVFLAVVTYYLDQELQLPFPGVMWIYLGIGFLFALFCSGVNFLKSGMMAMIYVIAVMLVRYIISGFLDSWMVNFISQYDEMNDLVVGIACLLILFLFSRVIVRFSGRGGEAFSVFYWLVLMILLTAVFGLIVEMQGLILDSDGSVRMILLILFGVTVAVYLLFVRISADTEEQIRQSIVMKEKELSERHIKETEQLYEDMRVLRHELKNHDFYIRMLVENREYDKLEEYFEKRTDLRRKSLIDTGNITVNAILNAKMEEARNRNIPVTVTADLPAALSIEPGALVSLISNIWDNAMEHSDVQAPAMKVKIGMVKAYLSIVVSNRVSSDVLKENPGLRTSKQDPFRHGIGVKVIRQMTEKYDGMLDFSVEDGWFTVSILLKVT